MARAQQYKHSVCDAYTSEASSFMADPNPPIPPLDADPNHKSSFRNNTFFFLERLLGGVIVVPEEQNTEPYFFGLRRQSKYGSKLV
eukprot:scaffold45196_cov283-Amphora_coffeaeformis.AAC.1